MSDANPFAGGGEVGGTSSSKLRVPSLSRSKAEVKPVVEDEIITKEDKLAYVQETLKKYNYLESDIPVSDKYWQLKNQT